MNCFVFFFLVQSAPVEEGKGGRASQPGRKLVLLVQIPHFRSGACMRTVIAPGGGSFISIEKQRSTRAMTVRKYDALFLSQSHDRQQQADSLKRAKNI